MISQQTLTCEKGGTFSFEIDMQGDTDLTGASGSWVLAESWFDDAKILLTKPLSISYDAGIWKASVQLNPVDTLMLPIGTFFHDSKVALGDGTIGHVSSGTFVLDTRTEPEPLECERGDNFTFEIDVGDADLTSATATWTLAESWFDGARVYITKTNGSGLFIDAIAKKIVVQLIPQDTLGVPSGTMFHACDVTLNDGTVGRVASGTFILEPSVDIAVVPTISGHAAQTLSALGQTVALTSPRTIAAAQTLGPLGQAATATAGGGVSPDFQTDFTAISSLPTGVSFSRATTGTYFDASGVLQTAAIDAPRFDHTWNGSAWVAKGLLIEEQRTNQFLKSNDCGDSVWSASNVAYTSGVTTGPDGTLSGGKQGVTFGGGSSLVAFFFQGVSSGTNGNICTVTIFLKQAEARYCYLAINSNTGDSGTSFDLQTGVKGNNFVANGAGPGVSSSSITPISNGWYRLQVSVLVSGNCTPFFGPCDNTTTTAARPIYTSAAVGDGLYIFGAHVEVGPFATSYIPTTSAAVTRSADNINITGSDFTGLYNQPANTFIIEFTMEGILGSNQYPLGLSDGAGLTNFIGTRLTPSIMAIHNFTGAGVLSLTVPSVNVPTRIVFAQAANDHSASQDGSAAVTSTATAAMPTLTRLDFGDLGGPGSIYKTNMWLRGFAAYKSRLSDATLQTKSVVGAAF